jgi:hypothetical protein
MFKFFFITFLLIVFFVFLFGFSVLRILFLGLFGTRPKPDSRSQTQQKASQSTKQQPQAPKTKKIITPDEGEYVDFVEIKD